MHSMLSRFSHCCAVLALAAGLSASLQAQVLTLKLGPTPPPANEGAISKFDCTFMRKAANTGTKEIAISEAVLSQLSNSETRAFAQQVIADHTAANTELLALARHKGVGFGTRVEPSLFDDWSRKTDGIDHRYIREIVSDHLDTIDLFERASKSTDPDVAAFAQRTLATLQRHLVMAHDVRKTFN
jgi:putative membrane protein